MIGKWNKSVILTYIGLGLCILGIYMIINNMEVKYALLCFIGCGICDMFDGAIARKCKRTKEEKKFGVELDSLVDAVCFVGFPIVLLSSISNCWYYVPIYILYAIFGVARLGYFNVVTSNDNGPVKYYEGLPVTLSALIFPLTYLLSYVLNYNVFIMIYNLLALLTAVLFIIKIKIPKPKLFLILFFVVLAIVVTGVYIFAV